MMVNKVIPSVDYNYWSKHLDTQLIEPTNQNSSPQGCKAKAKENTIMTALCLLLRTLVEI